jgi:hypothetical protein
MSRYPEQEVRGLNVNRYPVLRSMSYSTEQISMNSRKWECKPKFYKSYILLMKHKTILHLHFTNFLKKGETAHHLKSDTRCEASRN